MEVHPPPAKRSKWDEGAPERAPLLRKSVLVHGLTKQTELNGLTGFTLDFDAAAGRYVVAIDGKTYRLKTDNLQDASPPPKTLVGKLVEVQGLVNKPELNGKTGIASEFDAESGRYTINIEGTIYKLRAANLRDSSHKLFSTDPAKDAQQAPTLPDQPSAPPSIPRSTPPSEIVGKLIEVQGLVSKPELNGARALVKSYHFDVDRYEVELSDDQGTFKLKRENMRDLTAIPQSPDGDHQSKPEVIMTKTITINATHKGRMIGSGGEQIRKIQQESGAGIEILSPPSKPDIALIRITGTTAQLDAAEKMVEERLTFVREKMMQKVAQAAKVMDLSEKPVDTKMAYDTSWHSWNVREPTWQGTGHSHGSHQNDSWNSWNYESSWQSANQWSRDMDWYDGGVWKNS